MLPFPFRVYWLDFLLLCRTFAAKEMKSWLMSSILMSSHTSHFKRQAQTVQEACPLLS